MQFQLDEKAMALAAKRGDGKLYVNIQMNRGNCCGVPRMTIHVLNHPVPGVIYKPLAPEDSPKGIEMEYETAMDFYEWSAPIEVTTFGVGSLKNYYVNMEVNIWASKA